MYSCTCDRYLRRTLKPFCPWIGHLGKFWCNRVRVLRVPYPEHCERKGKRSGAKSRLNRQLKAWNAQLKSITVSVLSMKIRLHQHPVAVLRGGQGLRPSPRENCPPMKLVARQEGYTTAVFTAWHRDYTTQSCTRTSGILAPLSNTDVTSPLGRPPQSAVARNAPPTSVSVVHVCWRWRWTVLK